MLGVEHFVAVKFSRDFNRARLARIPFVIVEFSFILEAQVLDYDTWLDLCYNIIVPE